MSDDRLIRANEREIFEAVISQLDDPEVVRLRRVYALLSVGLFVLGSVVVTMVVGLGWLGLGAFCSTFAPGTVIGWTITARRFRGFAGRTAKGGPPLIGSRWRR